MVLEAALIMVVAAAGSGLQAGSQKVTHKATPDSTNPSKMTERLATISEVTDAWVVMSRH